MQTKNKGGKIVPLFFFSHFEKNVASIGVRFAESGYLAYSS